MVSVEEESVKALLVGDETEAELMLVKVAVPTCGASVGAEVGIWVGGLVG